MANKRKTTTAIVAGVTAAALLLGGTFAWTSISQQAKNEAAGIVNVGGRLHDDFNGTNKDVYVENFTDPLNGGQPIYARVKLTEYMEVGKDAGGNDVDNDGTIDADPVINGTERDKTETWKPHIPNGTCAICESGDTCLIHDHWTWTMGGDNDTTGQTTFMPTFNKDKDSLAADINGTYHGTDETDKIYYDDYVVYTTDNTTGGVGVAEDAKEAYDGSIYSVIGTEYYDNDTDTEDNGGVREVAGVTHTAKQTSTATVITMQDWIDNYDKAPGNYWVYDEDGWAYWANPIMPGESTGLLLDSIVMEKNPGEKCYYAINVVGQFATVGDWEYFTDDAPSEKAQELLDTVSKNVATVTVTNVTGATLLEPGESYEFSANVTVNGQQVLAASDFEWSVLNADKTVAKSTIEIDADGKAMLKVDEKETSKNLIVVAKATNSDYLGALGMTSVAVDLIVDAIDVTAAATEVKVGEQLQFTATVKKDGAEVTDEANKSVTWTVEGANSTDTTITNGLLSVASDETAATLTVKATSTVVSTVNGTATVTVAELTELEKLAAASVSTTTADIVTIDGIDWYVLAKEEGKALIWSANVVNYSTTFGSSNVWRDSTARTYLNGTFLNSLDVLKTNAVKTKIKTADTYNRAGEFIETEDTVFLLTEADVFGALNKGDVNNADEYTRGVAGDIVPEALQPATYSIWLRSPRNNGNYVAGINSVGRATSSDFTTSNYLRPAMWVNLES